MTRDLRKFARQTYTRLAIGGVVLLFVVGDGLIYLFYGYSAAITGFLCLLAGLFPIILIWLALWVLEVITQRANQD